MNRLTEKKIVLVTRRTRLGELINRFNTIGQAKFYVEHQGADFSDYLREEEAYQRALSVTQAALEQMGRVQRIDRSFLPNFVFAPDDVVVTLGQDGLVANVLKYLDGQCVVGVNPDPGRWDGRLMPFCPEDLSKVMIEVMHQKRAVQCVSMAQAELNNGQTLYAVNDLFIGPKTHTSARYILRMRDASEVQSSSGVIVSTGLGSTGWFASLLAGAEGISHSAHRLLGGRHDAREPISSTKQPSDKSVEPEQTGIQSGFAWNARYLFYTVREPFPTRTTGISMVFGRIPAKEPLIIESCMAENGVIFSDGMESDYLDFNSGTQAIIGLADRQGLLVV